jgi:hypothetical protein
MSQTIVCHLSAFRLATHHSFFLFSSLYSHILLSQEVLRQNITSNMTGSTEKDMAFAIFKTLSALGFSKAAASLAKEIKKKYSVTAIPDMGKVLKLAEVESKKEDSSESSNDDSSSSSESSDSDNTADLKTNKAQEKKDDSDSGSSSSDSSDDEKDEKVATPVKEKKVLNSSDSEDDNDEPEPPKKKAKATSGKAIKSHVVSPEEDSNDDDSDVSDVEVSDVSSVSTDDSSSSDDDDSSSDESSEDDDAKIEEQRKAKRKVAAEKAKQAAEAALSWTPKKSKAVEYKAEAGTDGAQAMSSGKPFRRVDDSYWGEKAYNDGGGMADNSYGNVFGDSGYGAKSSEKLLLVRGKKFQHEKTKRKRSFNGFSRGAGGIDMQSNSTKFA